MQEALELLVSIFAFPLAIDTITQELRTNKNAVSLNNILKNLFLGSQFL